MTSEQLPVNGLSRTKKAALPYGSALKLLVNASKTRTQYRLLRYLADPVRFCAYALQLPITHYPLPITHYPLPITHYPLPITNYPLPITNYQLPITNYPLPITKI